MGAAREGVGGVRWVVRVSPGGDMEEGVGCGWAGLAARWSAGPWPSGRVLLLPFLFCFLVFCFPFLLFIPFGFIKLLIYFNFEECENNT